MLKTLLPILTLAALLSAATALTAQETGTLRVIVTDEATGALLRGAEVRLLDTPIQANTGRDGEAILRNAPTGVQQVQVDYLGFGRSIRSVEIAAGDNAPLTFDLAARDDVIVMEEFTVSGEVGARIRALNQKRASDNVMDIISADALGQFPDKTIADAVKRLPGISVQQGAGEPEARYVTIRGMDADFNAVSVNGVRITVSNFDDASRAVPLDVIGSASADSIEVTKAVTPDMDADGIGGAINIRTRSAFDRNRRFASASANYEYNSQLADYDNFLFDEHGYEFAATYADLLGPDQAWGILISANTRNTPFITQSIGSRGFWDKDFFWDQVDNPDDGEFYFIPRGLILEEFHDNVEGSGLETTLDWRPSNDHHFRFNLNWNERNSRNGRQRQAIEYRWNRVLGSDDNPPVAPVTEGDTFVAFSTEDSRLEREVRDFYEVQTVTNMLLEGSHYLDAWQASWQVAYTLGEFAGDEDDLWVNFRTNRRDTNTFEMDPGNPWFPRFTSTADRMDPAEYSSGNGGYIDRTTQTVDDEEYALSGDLQYDFLVGGNPAYLKFGAKARLRERDLDQPDGYYPLDNLEPGWRLRPDGLFHGEELVRGPFTTDYGVDRIVDGRYEYGFRLDPNALRDTSNFLINEGLIEVADDSDEYTLSNTYDAAEDIYALYAMGHYRVGSWSFLAGLRAEWTEVEFASHSRTQYDTARGREFDPRDEDQDGVLAIPVSDDNDYVNWLPGFHARYDLTQDMVMRFAWTNTIARPSYTQLNPSVTTSQSSEFPVAIISVGNTDLDPVESMNFDLSFDWYFGSSDLLSVALFYKDMKNNIYTLRRPIGPDEPGFEDFFPEEDQRELRQTLNAEGAEVLGVELTYEQQLTFLPAGLDGLRLRANLTLVDSEVDSGREEREGIETPLFGQVETIANLALAYEGYGFQVRLAWNYQDDYLLFGGLEFNPLLDRYDAGHQIWDLTVTYEINDQWEVFAEVLNITDEPNRVYDGNADLRLDYNDYADWRATLGARWNL